MAKKNLNIASTMGKGDSSQIKSTQTKEEKKDKVLEVLEPEKNVQINFRTTKDRRKKVRKIIADRDIDLPKLFNDFIDSLPETD